MIRRHFSILGFSFCAIVCGAPDLLAQPVLTRGPYLQLGGETTMTIVWNTDVPASGAVEFGDTAALGAEVSAALSGTRVHLVTLEGLTADTEYHYRVRSDGEVLAEGLTFRTFPPTGCSGSFRLVAWGDSGVGGAVQLAVAARIDALDADLAVHTGDVIYPRGEAENYDPRYFEPYQALVSRINVYNSLGNHDYLTDLGQPYLDALYLPNNNPQSTERYYSFDYANVHIVAVDTNQDFERGSAQHDWLEADLAGTEAAWKLVFHHHTPYTASNVHARNPINLKIREHLGVLYDRYGVDFVLAGHSHAYERTFPIREAALASTNEGPDYVDPPGTFYVTTGGGGRSLYDRIADHPNNVFPAVYVAELHATLLEFDGYEVTGSAINVAGETIDAFTVTKTAETPPDSDCNTNGLPDDCELAAGTSGDCNGNAVLDECEPDCNGNATADDCDLAAETSPDVNVNGVPDECEPDCNDNSIPDSVELADPALDSNENDQLDECEPALAVALGTPPEPFIIDLGTRAIAFAMTLNAPAGDEDVIVRVAEFGNVAEGRLADLVEKAELFRDGNGNGFFDGADQRIGLAPIDLFASERIEFSGLNTRLEAGTQTDVFLVLGLNVSEPAASALVSSRAAFRLLLAILSAMAVWRVARGRSVTREFVRGRPSWVAGAVLIGGACLLGPGCGGGGGGSRPGELVVEEADPLPAGSRELQLRLDTFEARSAETDSRVLDDGIPLLGWPFELLE